MKNYLFYLKFLLVFFVSFTSIYTQENLSCDFDKKDFCGWSTSNSNKEIDENGFSFVESNDDGFFIKFSNEFDYSKTFNDDNNIELFSPKIVNFEGCFKFKYFQTDKLNKFKVFIKYSNQSMRKVFDGFIQNKDSWNEISTKISSKYTFQIILAATSYQSNSGIIAVDDIELKKYCKSFRISRQAEEGTGEENINVEENELEEPKISENKETTTPVIKTTEKLIPETTNAKIEPEIITTTLKLDDQKTTFALISSTNINRDESVSTTTSKIIKLIYSTSDAIQSTTIVITKKVEESPMDSTPHAGESTTIEITKKIEESPIDSIPDSIQSTTIETTKKIEESPMGSTSHAVESTTIKITKKLEELPVLKPRPTQSIRVGLNKSTQSNLPSSIEKIFGNANLSVLLISGGLIIVAAPTVLFFAIYFVYKKRKYQLKSAYTEFDDMLKTDSSTIIKRIRRIQSDGTLKNLAKKSLSISSDASKNSKNSHSDKNNKFKNKKSKINVGFKDEFNENTNM